MAMTPKERLFAIARGEAADRPPCICPGGMMNMMFREIMEQTGCPWPESHVDPEKMYGLSVGLYQAGGFENYGVPFDMTVEAQALGAKVEMGDLLCEPHVVDSPLAQPGDYVDLAAIDLESGRIPCVRRAIEMLHQRQDGVPVIANLTGPMSLCGTLTDMDKLMRAMRKAPETAHGLMDFAVEQLTRYGQALVDAGADCVCISDPSASGEILGPKYFREYAVPALNKLLDGINVPVKIVHICGRLHSVYEQLADLHCQIFSFDAIVPVREIKPYLLGKAVMGNISTLALGETTEERIRGQVRQVKQAGVDVVAPACGLPTITPLAIVQALVDEAKGGSVCPS